MKKAVFLIIVMLIGAVVFIFSTYDNEDNKSKTIEFTRNANSSDGSYWEYELSTDTVITEVDYYTSKFPLNFGSGYKQHWTFEAIGEGEVTISWIAYEGDTYDEKHSYSVTYSVDSKGKFHLVS